jgi:hypothetical protein
MKTRLGVVLVLLTATTATAQLKSLETDHFNVVYFPIESYLAPHVARCFENSFRFNVKLFNWTPSERVTLFLHDFGDAGNAGASAVPNNHITITIAPFPYDFEILNGNERMNWMSNHELIHVIAVDEASHRDRAYRRLFGGKVLPTSAEPLSILYSYLTTPRLYAPRWYQEGIAVFMETWRTGGLGRAMGAYDEMVFRTKVADHAEIYDLVGLASAASKLDFQVGVNAYLYGTRFMSYLALTYGPDKVIRWVSRGKDSKAWYSSQFKAVFGEPLPAVWSRWIASERSFQEKNLEHLAEYPLTPYRKVTDTALGSVSRAVLDRATDTVYLGVEFPGQVSHIMSINLKTGATKKLIEIKGPTLFAVTSLTFEPKSRTLFYTTNNDNWRDLRGINVDTGHSRTYIKRGRIGNLTVDPTDASLWGVRTYNGISTLVRIAPPYTQWQQIKSFDYGTDIYDLDISPDGKQLVAALTRPSGNQSLVTVDIDALIAGKVEPQMISDFEDSSPANFVFSADGRYLFGSSFYSGVSNLYRVNLQTKDVQAITNADTGYFRPVPLSTDELLAFRFTASGFLPVLIDIQPVPKVNAISFLGEKVVEAHPVLKDWKVPPPSTVDLGALHEHQAPYSPFATFHQWSLFPIVEGYKSYPGVGLRWALGDSIGYNRLALSAAYSPSTALPTDERLHVKAEYDYLNWKVTGAYNYADFYDLFGPTKRSFRGYWLGTSYKRYLIYDQPHRTLDWGFNVTGYGNLETVPGAQNVAASAKSLGVASLNIGYKYERSSLGSVEPEKGIAWRATLTDQYAQSRHFPNLELDFDLGTPLPIRHTSLWLRTSAGAASGDRADPFANFYFGGFRNNWVDDKPYRRFQEPGSFPGIDIDALGGKNYAKALLELNLPPVVFTRLGTTSFFANWASLALFTGAIATNLDDAAIRRNVVEVGAQLDIRLVALSLHQFTLSFGYANAYEGGRKISDEFMASLRIPFYD